ncbi:MAG: hypothetical protein LN560_03455 [Rickettsia endosymbiont of Sceptobius lativentris]|nr:hypothetical protein [Rickettsia endosymbiont of Sceptobius lativentris]
MGKKSSCIHVKRGKGIVNSVINKLPFEAHIPGYKFCGPGTKLRKRLQRGDVGVNGLDSACRTHDIAYSNNKSLEERHKADKLLEEAAWERVKAKDSTIGEKAAAWAVTTAMKVKRKLGMGIRKKKKSKTKKKKLVSFNSAVIKKVKPKLININGQNLSTGSNIALSAAKVALKESGGRRNVKTPRIIPVPKFGGILPLIPIFAGLSALGALAGGAAGVAKAVSDVQNAKKTLKETNRHNQTMEAIAIGKSGSGLYLKPYKRGYGLFLSKQQSKNF